MPGDGSVAFLSHRTVPRHKKERRINMRQNNNGRRISRRIALFFAIMTLAILSALPVMAAPRIKKTDYEKKGLVEVDFRTDVTYKKPKVTVKDSTGKTYQAVIVEKDEDDLTFRVKNYRTGKKYTYQISGVRAYGDKKSSIVKGTFKIPKKTAALRFKEVSYDAEDREVEFEFDSKVRWKNAKVTISMGGTQYVKRIIDKDRDSIETVVKRLERGKTYSYQISGVCKSGQKKYVTVKGTFRA